MTTSGSRRSSSSELGPKIVHIETRYVQTDAIHFRDVVQRLTGKNSSFETAAQYGGGVSSKPDQEYANATTDGTIKNSILSSAVLLKNMSFKDFDGFLSDLPSMEELLCSY